MLLYKKYRSSTLTLQTNKGGEKMALVQSTGFPWLDQKVQAMNEIQQAMFWVLYNIFREFVLYGITNWEEIQFLCSKQSREPAHLRENAQKRIAQSIICLTQQTRKFNESLFDPWSADFRDRAVIQPYINDKEFWESCPGFMRATRGLLTAILRKYRQLKEQALSDLQPKQKGEMINATGPRRPTDFTRRRERNYWRTKRGRSQ